VLITLGPLHSGLAAICNIFNCSGHIVTTICMCVNSYIQGVMFSYPLTLCSQTMVCSLAAICNIFNCSGHILTTIYMWVNYCQLTLTLILTTICMWVNYCQLTITLFYSVGLSTGVFVRLLYISQGCLGNARKYCYVQDSLKEKYSFL